MTQDAVVVGVDVAKDWLDVAVWPFGERWRAPNDRAGLAELVARLRRLKPALVAFEATGGYERPLAAALAGPPRHRRRTKAGAPGALHGSSRCKPLQPGPQDLLQTPRPRRKTQEARPHRTRKIVTTLIAMLHHQAEWRTA